MVQRAGEWGQWTESKSAVPSPAAAMPAWNGRCNTRCAEYYHKIVAVAVVSAPFPIPLGIRFQKDGEGEVACALALLKDLDGQLGRRFPDVLVGDALYLQSPFVKEVEGLGLDWAFTLKENQPELLREAGRELRWRHLPEVDWPVADHLVRVVKTVRLDNQHRIRIVKQDGRRIKKKVEVTRESTNFYATNFHLGSIPPLFIHQLGRARRRIDTEVFQTITVDCHLKHAAVHQSTALVVLTMIRVLAYTLSLVFYHRQVRSHARGRCETFREVAQRIGDWFVARSMNTIDRSSRRVAMFPAVFPGVHPYALDAVLPSIRKAAQPSPSIHPFPHPKPPSNSRSLPKHTILVPNPRTALAGAHLSLRNRCASPSRGCFPQGLSILSIQELGALTAQRGHQL